ncbi:MAG: nucleotide exchange factor GrpE [Deltaproteobacteria bacterium]|nr:nucleotide exchange factor GrpE [Deltaproteobacteria bacterium]
MATNENPAKEPHNGAPAPDAEAAAESAVERAEKGEELEKPAGEAQTEALQKELEAEKKKYLYLYAEFENYKKRAIRERSELVKFGNENLIRELLHIVDNLARAIDHAKSDPKGNFDAMVAGIEMVNRQFKDSLKKFGVEAIAAEGQKFDPEKHEAVAQEPVEEESEIGKVLFEHQKGYLLNGRLLRPAKVVVGAGKPPAQA